MGILKITTDLLTAQKYQLIDLSSSKIFLKGHIPGAINIPLMLREHVLQKYLLFPQLPPGVSPDDLFINYSSFFQQLQSTLPKNKIPVFYGSSHSKNSHWLSQLLPLENGFIENGFAQFLKYQDDFFSSLKNVFLLLGKTGSGKTEILKSLKIKGAQVIDLEEIANHKGSVFGFMKNKKQPNSIKFANLIWKELINFDLNKPIFFENKGRIIGRCKIPDKLFLIINSAIKIAIEITDKQRVESILNNYKNLNKESILIAVEKIKKKLKEEEYTAILSAVKMENKKEIIKILFNYYDRADNYLIPESNNKIIKCAGINSEEIAESIFNTIFLNEETPTKAGV